jgi:DNA polymerase phi
VHIDPVIDQSNQRNEILSFVPKLRDCLLNVMSSACKGTLTLTTSQVKDLLKLSLLAVRQTRRSISQNDCSFIWQLGPWNTLCENLASAKCFKGSTVLQSLCQQIIQAMEDHDLNEARPSSMARKRKKVEDKVGDGSVARTKAKLKA